MIDLTDYKENGKTTMKYTDWKEFFEIGDSDGNSPTIGEKAKTKKFTEGRKPSTHISIGTSCEKKEGIRC